MQHMRPIVCRTNKPSLNIRFREHIRYIRNNNPQSAYALHILQNQHEYGQMNSVMTLLKHLNNPSLLIPYEQYYIQTLHREGKLILEQSPGEAKPLFQMAISTQPPHTTQTEQQCLNLQNGHFQTSSAINPNTQRSQVCTVQSQTHIQDTSKIGIKHQINNEIHQTQSYAMNTITYHIAVNYNTPTSHNRRQSTSHQTAPLHSVKIH